MTNRRPSTPDRTCLDVELHLPDLAALFEKPDLTPFSLDYHRYSYESAMEYLAYRLYADRKLKTVAATFIVPDQELSSTTHHDVQEAIQRWTAAKIEETHIEVQADTTRGSRALLLGTVALVTLLLMAHGLFQTFEPGYLRSTAITALQIGAWIALWIPIDRLAWSAWTHRNDRVVYERLAAMTFSLEPKTDGPNDSGGKRASR